MKLLAKIIIVIAVFLAGFYFGHQQVLSPSNGLFGSDKTDQVEQTTIQVSLILDFSEDNIQTFDNIELEKETTVFELLEKITQENNLEFSYKDYGLELGALVESINNISNDTKADLFWNYWVNNVYAEVGASNYHLKDGDKVEWKYTENPFD